MPQGLQVWNASGQILLDLTDRVFKSVIVETVTETGTDNIPHTGADGSSSIVAVPLADGTGESAPLPSISVGGGNVTVTWGGDGRGSGYSRDILIVEY